MAKKRSKIRTKLEELAVRAVIGGLGVFPYRVSLAIGKGFGRVISSTLPRLKKTVYRNLEIAMPGNTAAENKAIARGTYESLGRQLGFVSHFRKFKPEDIRKLIELIGMENFERAHETGRGVLFFTGHFGSWEVFGLLSAAFGYPMNILVRRMDNPLVEAYIDSLRTKFGNITLGKKQAPREMFRLLEEGGILGILADLNAQLHDGIFVDFLGVPACTTTSIAKIALKTNAILLPAFAIWDDQKRKYVVYLEPPIDHQPTGDRKKDIRAITEAVTGLIETYVKKYPEQWLWIHKRWKTRPKGEADLYE